MSDEKIKIELNKDEAIVLFEFISRLNENKDLVNFDDQAEQRILWDLESLLEKELSESFNENYQQIVEKAKDKVRDK